MEKQIDTYRGYRIYEVRTSSGATFIGLEARKPGCKNIYHDGYSVERIRRKIRKAC